MCEGERRERGFLVLVLLSLGQSLVLMKLPFGEVPFCPLGKLDCPRDSTASISAMRTSTCKWMCSVGEPLKRKRLIVRMPRLIRRLLARSNSLGLISHSSFQSSRFLTNHHRPSFLTRSRLISPRLEGRCQ